MDAKAAEAFLNATHRIYGLRMLPLSLAHAFALEAIGSPFFEGRMGTEAELRMAAWICSRPPLALPETIGLKFRVWSWLSARMDFNEQVAHWRAYVADYCAGPQFWNRQPKAGEDRPEPSRVPTSISTVVQLMRLNFSAAEAWATPVGAADWYCVASYEAESGARVEIVTDAERAAIARMKAKEASNG